MQAFVATTANQAIVQQVSFANIQEDYATLHTANASAGNNFFSKLLNVARYEDLTFQLIMDCCTPNGERWFVKGVMTNYDLLKSERIHMVSRDFTETLEQRLHGNVVLASFFEKQDWLLLSLEGMKELLLPTYKTIDPEVLADIYSQDIYNLINPQSRVPIVLFRYNRYIGHIYEICPDDTRKSKVGSFIGIRESIYNMLCKAHDRHPVRGVAFYILRAAYSYIKAEYPKARSLELNTPIGPMVKIAERFGFEYSGESFDLKKEPLVEGYESTITII